MNATGLGVLVRDAFSGLTSFMNGKAWMRSMVTVALLYNFLKDGTNIFEDISQYLSGPPNR